MRPLTRALLLLACAVAALTPTASGRAAGQPLQLSCPAAGAADALAVPPGRAVPAAVPPVSDPVVTVALQHLEAIDDVTDFGAYRAKLACEMDALVLPHLRAGHANLVTLTEYAGLEVFAAGERGAAARQLAATPAGRGALDAGGAPTAAAAGLGATGGAYASALAFYHLPPAGSAAFSVHDLFAAATDTMVRGFVMAMRDAAARYSAEAGGPVWLTGSAPMVSRWHAVLRSATDPATYLADCAALYADPSQCATAAPDRLYVADETAVYNVAFVVGPNPTDPDHPFIGLQRKVNLVALEGPSLLDLTPGTMADLQPITLPGTAARLGIAISLDAFETSTPCNPAHTDTVVACLDARGADVLIQLEANDALTPSASWADYIDTSQDTTGGTNPQWQPLTYMDSAWLATADPRFRFRYAVMSFMVGNLLDIAFDGQSAIFSRAGSHCGHLVGNARFLGPYPQGGPDEAPFAAYAGDKPQFLALAAWAIPDADRSTLQARARAMAPGSGSPLENMERETSITAELTLTGSPAPAGRCPAPPANDSTPASGLPTTSGIGARAMTPPALVAAGTTLAACVTIAARRRRARCTCRPRRQPGRPR